MTEFNIIGWHRTRRPSAAEAMAYDQFTPSGENGALYGNGVYMALDLQRHLIHPNVQGYGDYMVELQVEAQKIIWLDLEENEKIYNERNDISDQLSNYGLWRAISSLAKRAVRSADEVLTNIWNTPKGRTTTSFVLEKIHRHLSNVVDGIQYTGRGDGKCLILYRPELITPIRWGKVINRKVNKWEVFSKSEIRRARKNAATLPVRWLQRWQHLPESELASRINRCLTWLGPERFVWAIRQLINELKNDADGIRLLYMIQIHISDKVLLAATNDKLTKLGTLISYNAQQKQYVNRISTLVDSNPLQELQDELSTADKGLLTLLLSRIAKLEVDYVTAAIHQIIEQMPTLWQDIGEQSTSNIIKFIDETNDLMRMLLKQLVKISDSQINFDVENVSTDRYWAKRVDHICQRYFDFLHQLLADTKVNDNLRAKYLAYCGFAVTMSEMKTQGVNIYLESKYVEASEEESQSQNDCDDDDDDDDDDHPYRKRKKLNN